jgi:hypothetical protein
MAADRDDETLDEASRRVGRLVDDVLAEALSAPPSAEFLERVRRRMAMEERAAARGGWLAWAAAVLLVAATFLWRWAPPVRTPLAAASPAPRSAAPVALDPTPAPPSPTVERRVAKTKSPGRARPEVIVDPREQRALDRLVRRAPRANRRG